MHKSVQGCARPQAAPTTLGCCHPIGTRGAWRAVVPQLPQEATSRCRVPVVLGLARPPCPHHAQGMLGPVSGLKINSLGTLGKKEAISVTALPKRLSPCVALARLLLLEISRHREALLRTSDTLFTSPIPRHSFSSRAVATAPFFSRSLGREMGGSSAGTGSAASMPRAWCLCSGMLCSFLPGCAGDVRLPSHSLITHQSRSGLQMGRSCFSLVRVWGVRGSSMVQPPHGITPGVLSLGRVGHGAVHPIACTSTWVCRSRMGCEHPSLFLSDVFLKNSSRQHLQVTPKGTQLSPPPRLCFCCCTLEVSGLSGSHLSTFLSTLTVLFFLS